MKVTFLFCATFLLALPYAKPDPVGDCPDEMNPEKVDFLIDDNDCTVFYKCDWGKPVKYDCPDDLHFNRELEVCDWPEAAGCDGSGGDDSGSDSSSSSSSSESEEGSVDENEEDEEEEEDKEDTDEGDNENTDEGDNSEDNEEDDEESGSSSSSSSSSESNESGSGEGKCPNDPCPKVNGDFPVYFAHPETCGRFCQCDWGVAHDMPCPDGLHFNTKLNVCDWPADAGCE